MGHQPADASHDSCRVHSDESDKERSELDLIFKAGAEARRHDRSEHDNPYAAGSEERDEWAAGWGATPDLDETDPGSPL